MDDSEVYFDGDNVYIGHLSASRVPALAAPVALAVHSICGLLLVLAALFLLARAALRKIRAA